MKKGYCIRLTKQRRLILEELSKVDSHPSADELYELIRKRLPRISLGTVYRNLELLARKGMIRRIVSSGSQMRFDATMEDHHHIRCIRCGRVDDILFGHEISERERVLLESTGYDVREWRVEFLGLCPSCRAHGGRLEDRR